MGLDALWRAPWSAWEDLVHDPAGFVDGLRPSPLRALGIRALAAATWAASTWANGSSTHGWTLEPSHIWPSGSRSLSVESDAGRILVIAHGPGDNGWAAAGEAAPGAPGLLRLLEPPARLDIHRYDGPEDGGVRISPWSHRRLYRDARRAGLGVVEALRIAWPASGRRFRGDEKSYGVTSSAYRAWRSGRGPAPTTEAPWAVVEGAWSPDRPFPLEPFADAAAIIFIEAGHVLAPDAEAALVEAPADPSVSQV